MKMKMLTLCLYVYAAVVAAVSGSNQENVFAPFGVDLLKVYASRKQAVDVDESVLEDMSLNFTQLAVKYGYPVELHEIETSDGYILTVHRIPGGKHCDRNNLKGPILLVHGLLSSSDDFISNGPNAAPGYHIADKCYDSWFLNTRGNKYSQQHRTLTVKDKDFWAFSWHEMGDIDVPTTIDYILKTTGESSLHYVGHSQGTTVFFVFASLYDEYHSKIRSAHMLAPSVWLAKVRVPGLALLAKINQLVQLLAEHIHLYDLSSATELIRLVLSHMCQNRYPTLQALCLSGLESLTGSSRELVNTTMIPILLAHFPSGCSALQLVHYAQLIQSGKFRMFNHGLWKNLEKYKMISPPVYNLTNIKIPIALYYSENDWLSHPKNVVRLTKVLPNLIESYKVPNAQFGHLEYLVGVNVTDLVYKKFHELLLRY